MKNKKIVTKKIDIGSVSVNCDEDTNWSRLINSQVGMKTEFHNIPKAEAVRAQAWIFAFSGSEYAL